jgi:hypothetical protein
LLDDEKDEKGTATPTYQEPNTPQPVTQTSIFGITIEEAVRRSGKLNPNCPDVVTKCINYLSAKGKDYLLTISL